VTTALRLSGVTPRLSAIDGTAVLTIVESSCSMNNAVATTQGRYFLTVDGSRLAIRMALGERDMNGF